MTDDDITHEDEPCPKCGHCEVRSRRCDVFDCEDGYIDEYEDDPINYSPGEEYTMCNECYGTGVLRWCAGCGFDIGRDEYKQRKGADER